VASIEPRILLAPEVLLVPVPFIDSSSCDGRHYFNRHGRRSIVVGEESDNKFRPAQNPQSGRQKPQNANGIGTDLSNKYYRPFQKMNPSDIDHLLDERRSQKTKLVQ